MVIRRETLRFTGVVSAEPCSVDPRPFLSNSVWFVYVFVVWPSWRFLFLLLLKLSFFYFAMPYLARDATPSSKVWRDVS